MPAVNSGRRVIDSPPRSSNVYISLETTSVVSPIERANTAVVLDHRHLDPLEAVQPAHAVERRDHRGEAVGVFSEQALRAPDGLRSVVMARGLKHISRRRGKASASAAAPPLAARAGAARNAAGEGENSLRMVMHDRAARAGRAGRG